MLQSDHDKVYGSVWRELSVVLAKPILAVLIFTLLLVIVLLVGGENPL